MKKTKHHYRYLFLAIAVLLMIIVLFFSYFLFSLFKNNEDNTQKSIEKIILLRDNVKQSLIDNGEYRCCLEKPCDYCLINHKECDCLEEIVTGKHPCGECMGEILEGNGNRFLSEYFAKALSDEIGENHYEHLKEIISEKYNIPVENQL